MIYFDHIRPPLQHLLDLLPFPTYPKFCLKTNPSSLNDSDILLLDVWASTAICCSPRGYTLHPQAAIDCQ